MDWMGVAAANLAGCAAFPAQRMDMRWRTWDDMSVADASLPIPAPPNGAVLLEPLTEPRVDDVLGRIDTFFAGHTGGGWQIWSAWPTPDLTPRGYERFDGPCMIRAAGGSRRPAPSPLTVVEVHDAAGLRDANALVIEAFHVTSASPDSLFDERILGDPAFHIWVGYVEDRAVSTASAYVDRGVVGVYSVATTEDQRGKGYGEALTWEATLADRSLPAVLESSPMGQSVYERMGYSVIGQFVVWERKLPGSG